MGSQVGFASLEHEPHVNSKVGKVWWGLLIEEVILPEGRSFSLVGLGHALQGLEHERYVREGWVKKGGRCDVAGHDFLCAEEGGGGEFF